VYVCVCMCASVCVCVLKRESERARERFSECERARDIERECVDQTRDDSDSSVTRHILIIVVSCRMWSLL